MIESKIEKKLIDRVKTLGGISFKWVSPGASGVPDRIVLLPGGKVFFVELKTVHGRLSPLQVAQIGRLRRLGQEVRVLRGEMGVDSFIRECGDEIFA